MTPDFWITLGAAFGLMVVIEGLLYAVFPDAMKRGVALLLSMAEGHVRAAGLVAAVMGLGLVWLIMG